MNNILDQGDSSLQGANTAPALTVNMSDCQDVRRAFPSNRHHDSNNHSHCGSLDFGSNIYPDKHSRNDSQVSHDSQDSHHDSRDSQHESQTAIEKELLEACKLLQSLLDVVKAQIDAMEHQAPTGDTTPVSTNPATPVSDNTQPISTNPATPVSDNTQPVSTNPASGSDNTTPTRTTDTPSTSGDNISSATIAQVISQNNRTQATTHAEGDSNSNVLNAGRADTIPTGAKGISGWGLITNEDGAQVDRSASAQVQNMQTYVHLKTGGWKLVENQNDASNESKIAGMTENTNFTNIQQDNNVVNSNGVATLNAPPGAYTMKHFGVANKTWTPGTFDEGSIDGVFVRADAKANENNSGLIAKLGGEWWSNPAGDNNTILGVPGTNNFMKLTDQWQSMYFSSVSQATLENDPPPGIGNDTTAETTATHPTTPTDTTYPTNTTQPTSGDSSNSNTKLIIPFPTESQWPEILQKAPEGSLTFSIYSGNNDTPDTFGQIGQNVAGDLAKAKAKGLVPLGYMGTAAGTLSLDEAKRRVDLWMDAGAAGIFMGGSGKSDGSGYATDPASEAYYDQLANYIHDKGGKAFINGVYMNPATSNSHYYGTMDGQGMHEGFLDDFEKQMPNIAADPHPENEFAFVSGVQSGDLARVEKQLTDAHVGYLWVTDVNYGASPEYLSQEIANL